MNLNSRMVIMTGVSIVMLSCIAVIGFKYFKTNIRYRDSDFDQSDKKITDVRMPKLEIKKYARGNRANQVYPGLIYNLNSPQRYVVSKKYLELAKKIDDEKKIRNSDTKPSSKPQDDGEINDNPGEFLAGLFLFGLGMAMVADEIEQFNTVFGDQPGFGLQAQGYYSGDGKIGANIYYNSGDFFGYIDISEFQKFISACKEAESTKSPNSKINDIQVSLVDTDGDLVTWTFQPFSGKWYYKGYELDSVLDSITLIEQDMIQIIENLKNR